MNLHEQITNIRYGPIKNDKGTILFDIAGKTISISEPKEFILVGVKKEIVANWILKHYGFVLIPFLKVE